MQPRSLSELQRLVWEVEPAPRPEGLPCGLRGPWGWASTVAVPRTEAARPLSSREQVAGSRPSLRLRAGRGPEVLKDQRG